jgi:hypothetical protein
MGASTATGGSHPLTVVIGSGDADSVLAALGSATGQATLACAAG